MRRLFHPTRFANDEQGNIARSVTKTALGIILASVLFVVTAQFYAPELLMRAFAMIAVALPVSLLSILLLRRGYLQTPIVLLMFFFWVVVTISAISAGGVSAPIILGYAVVITLGGLTTNSNISIGGTLVCVLTGIFIALLETNNNLPEPLLYTPVARILIYIFFFLILFVFQSTSARNLRRTIEQSRENETKYRSLLENIPITTYINSLGQDSRTTYVSPQVERLLGYPRSIFLEDPLFWTKIVHPEDKQRVLEESSRTNLTEEPFTLEYRLITNKQKVIWVSDEARIVRSEQGKPSYWIGIWTDITSRKRSEEEQADLVRVMTRRTIQLQTAAEVSRAATSILDINDLLPNVVELIRTHFDYYYVGIFLKDEKNGWAILRAGSGNMGKKMLEAGHRLKLEESSMVGWCLIHKQARIALDVGEDAVRFANPYLPKTRSEIALPLITHGEVIGAMSIQSEHASAFSTADITALQAMSNLVANAIENARLFTERVELTRELETQNEELERFTYTVSHDLRSPLVTIRGFLGYLQHDAVSGDLSRFDKDMLRISSAVDKMSTLLNELLELSRVGRVASISEDFPFEEVVNETLDMLSGMIEAKKVEIKSYSPYPSVHADKIRIIEVMQNLVSNAIKFMGPQTHPKVEIGAQGSDDEGKLIFFVKDNGIGIDPQYHERIFGLFNRLDPTVEGTGVGLTIVKRIIEVHGGRIWLESKVGKGTKFLFTLPPGRDVKIESGTTPMNMKSD